MALQGTLDTFALPDVLRLLAATKKTGCLHITGTRGAGSLWVDGGAVSGLEVPHAPNASEPVDALFELLRFQDGAFTFDPEAAHRAAGPAHDAEELLQRAEAQLSEWREIESVVPSLDAWVTLRRTLGSPEVSIDQSHWTTVVAIGSGASVRRVADTLALAELPVSRAVRDLVERGLAEVAPAAPAGGAEPAPVAVAPAAPAGGAEPAPVAVDEGGERPGAVDTDPDAPLPAARPLRARRAKGPGVQPDQDSPQEPERFVPLELPGHVAGSYDATEEKERLLDAGAADAPSDLDDLAATFPGLANRRSTHGPEDDDEVTRQLDTLSPRAAEAVRAAALATTDEERDVALAEAVEGEGQPINRGLLLKFLSSVKS